MEYVFIKYRVNQKDYLVFDCNQHEYELTNEKIRRICRHHFGAGVSGFIMGPYLNEDTYYVRMFAPDGTELSECKDCVSVFARYLRDYGYVEKEAFYIDTANGLMDATISDGLIKVCPTPYIMNQKAASGTNDSMLINMDYVLSQKKISHNCSNRDAELSATSEEDVAEYAAKKVKETGKIITADHFIQWL